MGEPAEFGVTGDGELDLGLPAAAVRPARTPVSRPVPAQSAVGADHDDWLADYPGPDPDVEAVFSSDPENDPDDFEAWLAGLPAEVREEFLAGPFTGEGGPIPAGFLPHGRAPNGPQ